MDSAGAVAEADEANNVAASPASIPGQAAFVNLAGSFPRPVPTVVRTGRGSSVVLRVTNAGNVAARGPLTVTLSAATDPAGTSGLVPLRTLTREVKLRPGGKTAMTLRFLRPEELLPGSYYFSVALDAANAFLERDESDNLLVSELPFQVE